MNESAREKLLKVALVAFGAIFFLVYPLGLVWPSGWVWHGGVGKYYFQMICGVYAVLGGYLIAAARKPSEHRSLISFTIWSSVMHAGIMAAQSIYDEHERGHLIGDVPALQPQAAVQRYAETGANQSAAGVQVRRVEGLHRRGSRDEPDGPRHSDREPADNGLARRPLIR
jgi:hypothetical protein